MNRDFSVKELQDKVLDMMEWFHAFCVSRGLSYYAICGTMLGAARHHGYIPWDDDIDIAMPRADYNRLTAEMKNVNNEKYILETPYTEDVAYCYPISKLYDRSTTLIEHKRRKLVRGVFIDIFPLDGIGTNEKPDIPHFNVIRRNYNIYLSRVCAVRKERDFKKNVAIFAAGLIPQTLMDDRSLRIKIDKLCQKYDFNSSKWCGVLLSAWGAKEIVRKEIFGKPTLYKFEDIEIYGVQKYDEYLTSIYGNWRELPPVEKRVTHHDFDYLDLNRPYFD